MSRNFAVVLNPETEAHFLPALSAKLRKVENYRYFLAKEIDPNGPFFSMVLVQDAADAPGIELHIHHHMVLYVLAAEDVTQIGFH